MLILRRKAGEAIVLNRVIKIHVLAIEGERIKIGIDAPPDVVIVRDELNDPMHQPVPGGRDLRCMQCGNPLNRCGCQRTGPNHTLVAEG